MSYLFSIILAYIIIVNKNSESPHILRHPSIDLLLAGILYQPIINVSNNFRNFYYGRVNFLKLLFALLNFLIVLIVFSYLIFFILGKST